jgi:hypothetical protein
MRDHLLGLDETHVSYSELNALSQCEFRWHENYVRRIEGPPSLAMRFGTAVHRMVEFWWDLPADGAHRVLTAWEAAKEEQVELPDEGPRAYDDAEWLFSRYVEHYWPMKEAGWHRPSWCHGELTLAVDVTLPSGATINVRVTPDDFLVDPDGLLCLVERKTMSSWQRLELVDVTPQETVQTWAARANGYEIDRVLFDAIKSYRWALQKPTQKALIEERENGERPYPWDPPFGDQPPAWAGESTSNKRRTAWAREQVERHPGVEAHPPADSFELVPVYRDQDQIDGMLRGWMFPLLERREALLAGAVPVRNISDGCRRCPYQDTCWDELAFPPQEYVIEEDVD